MEPVDILCRGVSPEFEQRARDFVQQRVEWV